MITLCPVHSLHQKIPFILKADVALVTTPRK